MQCRQYQEKHLREQLDKDLIKNKLKPYRVYLAYQKMSQLSMRKTDRKVANDYLTQTQCKRLLSLFQDCDMIK